MVAAAVIGSAVVGAGATAYAANSAADAQTNAANTAAATQRGMYDAMRKDLQPYMDIGQTASNDLMSRMPFLTSPISMDQASLERTPGYQFNLSQGLKSVQNGAAARGLGTSGAAMKGAAQFATGLADNTYQNQFNNENINRTQAYNRLFGLVGLGQNAAAGVGNAGVTTGQGISSAQIGAGNAQAAGYNAMGGAVANGANQVGNLFLMNTLSGGSLFGNGGSGGGNGANSWGQNFMQGAGY